MYADDYADPLERYKEVTAQTTKSNPETMGRYHTNWLNMMYPRLRLAANLLRDDGVCFISIDDNEVTNLRKLCDEAFGEENYVGLFPWRKRTAKSDVPFGVSQDYEWILCYAKSADFRAVLEGGTRKYYETPDLPGNPWRIHDLTKQTSASERPNSYFTIIDPKTGKEYPANPNRTWAITQETFQQYYAENRIVFPGDYDFLKISKPALRYFKKDDMAKAGDSFGFIPVSTKLPDNIGMTQDGTKEITELFESKVFGFPKPLELVKFFVKAATSTSGNEGDIIIDFFSGSATTAHAVMQLNAEDGGNRQFIMVQLPEVCDEKSEAYKAGFRNICEIGKERIRRAGAKILADAERRNSQLKIGEAETPPPDVGFRVFKLDASNLKTWDSAPIEGDRDEQLEILHARMREMIHRIKPDRNALDMVFEVMLKMGVPLSLPVTEVDINGKTAYSVGEDTLLLISLAPGLTAEDMEVMADYAPAKVIISQESFDTNSDTANAYYILHDRGIDMKLL